MVINRKVESIRFENNKMFLMIKGKESIIDLNVVSKKLLKASKLQRELYKISPSGYGIHWPLIDEDLSIENLLKA